MRISILLVSVALFLGLPGCGGGSENTAVGDGVASGTATTDLRLLVTDYTGGPVAGAVVTVTVDTVSREGTTNAEGVAELFDIPRGEGSLSVSAVGFETLTFTTTLSGTTETWQASLAAEGAWAIGRAIVLDTQVLERTPDGSAITFSLDVAVIDGNSDPIETLTSADFEFTEYECGWGSPLDCASDAEGNAAGNGGGYLVDGGAQAFELVPPAARRPYVVGVLAERSTSGPDWALRAPALKSFFGTLSGNDMASLMSVQNEDGSTTFNALGPFTNDGATYFEAIDQLATPAEAGPEMLEAVIEAIDRVAAADAFGLPEVERHVLVVATEGLTVSEVQAAAEHARGSSVRVSTIISVFPSWYGLSELAVRTGGFVAAIDDSRQFGVITGAMDRALARTLPHYRMQFRLTGAEETFVPGGNVKMWLVVTVPSPLPNRGVWAAMDVAIP